VEKLDVDRSAAEPRLWFVSPQDDRRGSHYTCWRGGMGTGYVKNSGVSAAIGESVRERAAKNWHDFLRNPRIGGIIFGRASTRRSGYIGPDP
jgi:hypothetical protein